MDATGFIKTSRTLVLASALIAGSSIAASAEEAPIPLGSGATALLSASYSAPPTGVVTLGGHTFDLTAGTALVLGNGESASFAGSYPGFNGAYLLINSANTSMWLDQQPVGSVVLTFSDGTTQTEVLTVGVNLGEWRTGAGPAYISLPNHVWVGTATDGTEAVIDMLSIPASTASNGKTLTGVSISNTNTMTFISLAIMVDALTIDFTPPVPTPTLTCPEAGNASTNWASKDKHLEHCAEQGQQTAARQAAHSSGTH